MYKSIKTGVANLFAISLLTAALYTTAYAQQDTTLKITMPAAGNFHSAW
jgi:hypothetical protein